MYVEISPRQSGKTTRLISAAVDFLYENRDDSKKIAIVSHNIPSTEHLRIEIRKGLILKHMTLTGLLEPDPFLIQVVDAIYATSILKPKLLPSFFYNYEVDYWFFDEFAYMTPNQLLHPIYGNIIENAYYATSPSTNNRTIDIITTHCQNNGIQINFNNPWTEERIQEQSGFNTYFRNEVIGHWLDYMTSHGISIEIKKENLINKLIKRHQFTNGDKKF